MYTIKALIYTTIYNCTQYLKYDNPFIAAYLAELLYIV
jgi:hypothetical protein